MGGDRADEENADTESSIKQPQRITESESMLENMQMKASKWCRSGWPGAVQKRTASSSSLKARHSACSAPGFFARSSGIRRDTVHNEASRGSWDRRPCRKLSVQVRVGPNSGTQRRLPSRVNFEMQGPMAHSGCASPEPRRMWKKSVKELEFTFTAGLTVTSWNRCLRVCGSHREQTREQDASTSLLAKR